MSVTGRMPSSARGRLETTWRTPGGCVENVWTSAASTQAPPTLHAVSKHRGSHSRILGVITLHEETNMARLLPDPTFYPSPTMASGAPSETLAYVALLAPEGNGKKDALGVVGPGPAAPHLRRLVGRLHLPNGGNALHHVGWNACSSRLCAHAPNPHAERRYLIVPRTNSPRNHVIDTAPDPRNARLVKVIEGD